MSLPSKSDRHGEQNFAEAKARTARAGAKALARKLLLASPFEELVNRHSRELLTFFLRATRELEQARDLLQETFFRAYRAYGRLAPDTNFRAYLYTIATNLLRNSRRDAGRRRRVIADELMQMVGASGGDLYESDGIRADDRLARSPLGRETSYGDATDAILHLRALIARLPEKQRQALLMRKVAGLSYSEIGQALNCSAGAARVHVTLALRKLREQW